MGLMYMLSPALKESAFTPSSCKTKNEDKHTCIALDGEMNIIDGTQDLVDLADLGLVLEIHGSIEARNL